LFLLFFKQHATKAYRSGEVNLHALTMVLYTLPVAFNSRQTFPSHSERFVCAHMITIVNIPLQGVRVKYRDGVQVVGTDCGTLISLSPGHGLKTEAVSTSETSINFYETARRNVPEDYPQNVCNL
jgi:hypothetical protein